MNWRRCWLLCLPLAAPLLLAACGGTTSSPAETPAAKAAPPAQEQPKPSLLPTREEREKYIKKIEAELKELDACIRELEARARKAARASRRELDEALGELKKKRKVAQEKLEQLRSSSETVWNEVKAGTDAAVDEVKKTYERVRGLF